MSTELQIGLVTSGLAGVLAYLGQTAHRQRVIRKLSGHLRLMNHVALVLALAAALGTSIALARSLEFPVANALFALGMHDDPWKPLVMYVFLFLGLAVLVYGVLSLWWFGGFVITSKQPTGGTTPSEAATLAGTEAILNQVRGGRGGLVLAGLGWGICALALWAHGLVADTYVAGTAEGVHIDGFLEADGILIPWPELEALEVLTAKGGFDLTWRTRGGAERTITNDDLYGLDPEQVARVIAVHRANGVRVIER